MRRGFWRGLFWGGMAGAFIGMAMAPQLKPGIRRMGLETRDITGQMGSMIEGRARRIWRRARQRLQRTARGHVW